MQSTHGATTASRRSFFSRTNTHRTTRRTDPVNSIEPLRFRTTLAPWLITAMVCGALCGVTGALLSMYYVPSADMARDGVGRTLSIVEASSDVVVGPYGDTLALAEQRALVPDSSGLGISLARASVDVHIYNATGGMMIRLVHRASAFGLMVAIVGMLVVMVWNGQYAHRYAWPATVATLLVCGGALWMGMQLPDGTYAAASHGVVRAAIDDGMALGWLVEFMGGGSDMIPQRLSRLYTIHGLIALGIVALWLWWLWGQWGARTTGRTTLFVAILIMSVALMISWNEPNGHAAWYPFRLASVLQSWFGSELASYIVVGTIVGLASVPWWSSSNPLSARVFVVILVLAWLVAMVV